MATPRYLLVDPENPCYYHVVSRCVRRSFLCGRDPSTGQDYSHRKILLEARLLRLSSAFAVALQGYAIMDNHFHVVLHYDPKAADEWSDDEVARRWVHASGRDDEDESKRSARLQVLLADARRLNQLRKRLGSLSCFMQQLKQPIARLANQEDGVRGHFFEQRFYSGALLSESGLLAAMAYVDLNPVRARIADEITGYQHTGIARRLASNSVHRLREAIAPLASGLSDADGKAAPAVGMSLGAYVQLLRELADVETMGALGFPVVSVRARRWAARLRCLGRYQRAYGSEEELSVWLARRNMRPLEEPFD